VLFVAVKLKGIQLCIFNAEWEFSSPEPENSFSVGHTQCKTPGLPGVLKKCKRFRVLVFERDNWILFGFRKELDLVFKLDIGALQCKSSVLFVAVKLKGIKTSVLNTEPVFWGIEPEIQYSNTCILPGNKWSH